MPVYVQALLEQTAENMENLQRVLARGEDGRAQANQALACSDRTLATLSDTMRTNQQLMLRIAEAQRRSPRRCSGSPSSRAEGGLDEVARAHSAQHRTLLQRMVAEAEQGRAQSTADLRNDLRILTRTVAALAEDQPR